jgi:hypothetical protein
MVTRGTAVIRVDKASAKAPLSNSDSFT